MSNSSIDIHLILYCYLPIRYIYTRMTNYFPLIQLIFSGFYKWTNLFSIHSRLIIKWRQYCRPVWLVRLIADSWSALPLICPRKLEFEVHMLTRASLLPLWESADVQNLGLWAAPNAELLTIFYKQDLPPFCLHQLSQHTLYQNWP